MPVVHSLDKTMTQRIDEFYGNASIYRPNKFLVGFYGEYVKQAIEKLKSDATTERYANNQYSGNQKLAFGTQVYKNALDKWLETHYNDDDMQVELKWACSDATLPSVQAVVDSERATMDAIKSIKYPLINRHEGVQSIELSIVENRSLMFYQFFNALMNRFFIPQILKPRSSFHKLGMYVAVLQEDFVIPRGTTESGAPRDADLDAAVQQIFEYNSIVLKGVPKLKFENNITSQLTYSLNFDAPNTFQGSFKTSFKGLRNNGSDGEFLLGMDKNTLLSDGSYNKSHFEVSKKDLLTPVNGVYEKKP